MNLPMSDSNDMAKSAIAKCILNTRNTYDYYQTSTEWLAFSNEIPKLSQHNRRIQSPCSSLYFSSMRSERLLCECVCVSFKMCRYVWIVTVPTRPYIQNFVISSRIFIIAEFFYGFLYLWLCCCDRIYRCIVCYIRIECIHVWKRCFVGDFDACSFQNNACVFKQNEMKSLITSVMPKTYHYDQKRLINRPRAMIARILRETNWYIEKNYWIITNLSTWCNFNKWDASHHNLSTDYQWMRINRSPTTIASTKPLIITSFFFNSKNDLITFGERILSELTICNWPLSTSVMAQNRNVFSCQIFWLVK